MAVLGGNKPRVIGSLTFPKIFALPTSPSLLLFRRLEFFLVLELQPRIDEISLNRELVAADNRIIVIEWQDSGVIAEREWRRVRLPLFLLDALRSAGRAARPRAQIVPVAKVRRVAPLLLQLELLLVVPEVVGGVAQQTGEVRYGLPLRSDLSHETADLFEVGIVGSGKLTVVP